MSNELPPLPEQKMTPIPGPRGYIFWYSEEQLVEYGRACERAAYERAAKECRDQARFHATHQDYRYDFKSDGANECADAIEQMTVIRTIDHSDHHGPDWTQRESEYLK